MSWKVRASFSDFASPNFGHSCHLISLLNFVFLRKSSRVNSCLCHLHHCFYSTEFKLSRKASTLLFWLIWILLLKLNYSTNCRLHDWIFNAPLSFYLILSFLTLLSEIGYLHITPQYSGKLSHCCKRKVSFCCCCQLTDSEVYFREKKAVSLRLLRPTEKPRSPSVRHKKKWSVPIQILKAKMIRTYTYQPV